MAHPAVLPEPLPAAPPRLGRSPSHRHIHRRRAGPVREDAAERDDLRLRVRDALLAAHLRHRGGSLGQGVASRRGQRRRGRPGRALARRVACGGCGGGGHRLAPAQRRSSAGATRDLQKRSWLWTIAPQSGSNSEKRASRVSAGAWKLLAPIRVVCPHLRGRLYLGQQGAGRSNEVA